MQLCSVLVLNQVSEQLIIYKLDSRSSEHLQVAIFPEALDSCWGQEVFAQLSVSRKAGATLIPFLRKRNQLFG